MKEVSLTDIAYNSLGFKGKKLGLFDKAIKEIKSILLARFFNNIKPIDFDRKYLEAISGSGEEMFKMDAYYSSSLCSFLFFSHVSKDNPLIIDNIEYDEVYFEVKNKVFKGPSNMDVVLRSKDDKNLLFIECKFSEYLRIEKNGYEIKTPYRSNEVFKKLYKGNDELVLKDVDSHVNYYQAVYKNKVIYTEGIKQIIAHNIGLEHYRNNEFMNIDESDTRSPLFIKNKYHTRFKVVLFDFGEELNGVYKTYKEAVNHLKNYYGDDYLEASSYQDILKDNPSYKDKLPAPIKEFYHY